ncbi:MAG: cysteine--tRNA ligase [Thaumarchaeota archaeon]|nr:cysteine--tRNA ligase [Nitrososphaerota archaeon]
MLRLYNSLGRKLSVFKPMKEGEVRMYTCGPTVWNYAHIGNFRTFVSEDILRRYLIFKGYKVKQAKNLTDVEDRIIEGIKKTGKSLADLTDFYARAFMEDLDALNIQRAEDYPRATRHIPEMEAMIKSLLNSGHAYRAEDGSVYFSIRTFKRYGELSGVKVDELKEGARVSADHYEKLGAHDFALWKAWDANDGDVFWESELGRGRPGWHIECSAMAIEYLGDSFDIHTGGKDLRFPHHENEIAQSEAATGKRFAKYWLHSGFLRINGEEMHKSLGNMVTLRELLEKGWKPRAIRLFLIGAHYRDELNLTDESLQQAKTNISKMDTFARRLQEAPANGTGSEGVTQSGSFLKEFEQAMDDDLNVPEALAAFYGFQRTINSLIDSGRLSKHGRDAALAALLRVDSVLGVMQPEKQAPVSARVERLILERDEARRRRDYARSDEIRAQLKKEGITIEDKPGGGTSWKID